MQNGSGFAGRTVYVKCSTNCNIFTSVRQAWPPGGVEVGRKNASAQAPSFPRSKAGAAGACADAFFLAAVRVTEDGCRMVKVEIRAAKTERCQKDAVSLFVCCGKTDGME